MKSCLTILFIMLTLANCGLAADAESDLKAIEQRWSDAYVKGDIAALESIEADEYQVVDPSGIVATKVRDIKELRDRTFVVKSSSANELHVRMLGKNFACVRGLQTMKGTYKGEDISGQYRFLDVFEKKGNKGQAIACQTTKLPKTKPA